MFEPLDLTADIINIKIIGIGGCGLNAMQHLFLSSPTWNWNAEFIGIDTDVQAIQKLEELHTATTIQLEPVPIANTNANGNTIMNYQFNMQDRERIKSSIAGTTWLFIIAGMGGNTGTIIAHAVAQLAREMDIFTVAIISRPFLTDTSQRINFAKAGINQLIQHANSVIDVSNTKLFTAVDKDINYSEEFIAINNAILDTVKSIGDAINAPGLTCFSIEDAKTIMSAKGLTKVSVGYGTGKDCALEAAESAVVNLWSDYGTPLCNATGIFVILYSGPDMSISDFDTVWGTIVEIGCVSDTVMIAIKMLIDPNFNDKMKVVIVAAGFSQEQAK